MGNTKSTNSIIDLNDEKIDEISRKTKYQKDEVLKLYAEFMRDCPNGKLDKKLFTKIYKELFPFGDATKFCNICFLAYDKDKSGYIDFFEFVYAMGIVSKGNIEDKLRLAFDIYDTNDDGYIEKKEAEQIVLSLYQMYGENVSHATAKKQVEKIMTKFDKDKNGLLTEQEFIQGCLDDKEMLDFFVPNNNNKNN